MVHNTGREFVSSNNQSPQLVSRRMDLNDFVFLSIVQDPGWSLYA